jgi:N-methylhydantoinase A
VPVAIDVASIEQIERAFSEVYAARYGAATGAMIEIVSYRLAAWGLSDKPKLPAIDRADRSLDAAACGSRTVVFDGNELQVTLFDRDRLPCGQPVNGPALIEEGGSTTVVPPGWSAELDPVGCLILRRS